ncbi:hypothetical protein QBC43DRAFT_326923 [Cladorrhinum sp. PSN259]|nr:hypothetical protein QBC43DRAFT_326923 [Cladorrhinum sp. PSN259]
MSSFTSSTSGSDTPETASETPVSSRYRNHAKAANAGKSSYLNAAKRFSKEEDLGIKEIRNSLNDITALVSGIKSDNQLQVESISSLIDTRIDTRFDHWLSMERDDSAMISKMNDTMTQTLGKLDARLAELKEAPNPAAQQASSIPHYEMMTEDAVLQRVNKAMEQWETRREEQERVERGSWVTDDAGKYLDLWSACAKQTKSRRLTAVVKLVQFLSKPRFGTETAMDNTAITAGVNEIIDSSLASFPQPGDEALNHAALDKPVKKSDIPSPGKSFMITDMGFKHALALMNGELHRIPLLGIKIHANNACWSWECVEKNGWLNFRNAVSGTYLGYVGNSLVGGMSLSFQKLCVVQEGDGKGYCLRIPVGEKLEKLEIEWTGVETKQMAWAFVEV